MKRIEITHFKPTHVKDFDKFVNTGFSQVCKYRTLTSFLNTGQSPDRWYFCRSFQITIEFSRNIER